MTSGINVQSYRETATFYRAALLLGLVPGETVVQWAHDVIEQAAEVPHALLEVVLTPPGDLTALRNALQPLSDETESPAVLNAVFDLTRRDLISGRRSLKDTVMVLSQVRRLLTVSQATLDELDAFEDDFMLANAGVVGDVASIDSRVRSWLAPFEGAEQALRGERSYYVIECEQVVEAAAFIAALSRFLYSPAAPATSSTPSLVEVWSAPSASGNGVSLYLTEAAHRAAEAAFSPVPAIRIGGHGAVPSAAVRVLDGEVLRPLGLAEAQRILIGETQDATSGEL